MFVLVFTIVLSNLNTVESPGIMREISGKIPLSFKIMGWIINGTCTLNLKVKAERRRSETMFFVSIIEMTVRMIMKILH